MRSFEAAARAQLKWQTSAALTHTRTWLEAVCVEQCNFRYQIKTRTRIIGRRFQRTRTRIIVIQKTKTK